jgi:uncharacterized protein (DUF58 family)
VSKINRIKTKLNIHSTRRSLLMLEGEYTSALKGKSLDFDDLREYTYGDDVRDIDWRASAKNQIPLVKRYVANRRHNVLFVVDTSITMRAAAPDYQPKYELAEEVIGLLGYIAVKHNDNVGLAVINGSGKFERMKFMGGEMHLNRILDTVENVTNGNESLVDINNLLSKANNTVNSRTIMVVIANEAVPSPELKTILRKIKHRHDLLWVSIADINPASVPVNYSVMDIAEYFEIPEGLRADDELIKNIYEEDMKRKTDLNDFLTGMHVTSGMISTSSEVLPNLLSMLKRRERER